MYRRKDSWKAEKYMILAMVMFFIGFFTGNVEETTWIRWGKIVGPWIKPAIYTLYVLMAIVFLWIIAFIRKENKDQQGRNNHDQQTNKTD